MPFDNENFPARKDAVVFAPAITPPPMLPAEPLSRQETDPVLRLLAESRAKLAQCWWAGQGQERRHLDVGNGNCTMNTVSILGGLGALERPTTFEAMDLLAATLGRGGGWWNVWEYNDKEATHADVLALFDRAIEARHAAVEK